MEGSSAPESEPSIPKDTEEKQPKSQKTPKSSWKDRAKNLPLRYKLATAGAALTTVATGVFGLNKASQGGSNTETPITPTPIVRTVAPVAESTHVADHEQDRMVVEITPAPTENTPIVTPQETTTDKHYTIEVMPNPNTEFPAYETYTVEQSKQIIDTILGKYPTLKDLKIHLVLGGGVWYDSYENIITIDRSFPDLEISMLHELAQHWDNVTKDSPDIQIKRAAVLADPQIGRSYPSFDRLFSGNVNEALNKFYSGESLSLEDLRVITSQEADSMYIYDPYHPLNEYLDDTQFEEKKQSGAIPYASLADFLNGEKRFLSELSAKNPFWKVILEDVKSNDVKYETVIKDVFTPLYYDQQASNYYNALWYIARIRLSEQLLADDPQVTSLFSEEDRSREVLELEERMKNVDTEKFADLISKYIYLKDAGHLTEQNQAIEDLTEAIFGYGL